MQKQRKVRPPRHFLYLNHDVAESYYSDLIGWVPDEGGYTDRSGENKGSGWNLGYKGTGYGRNKGEESGFEESEKFRHTPASLFNNLHRKLDEEGMLIYLRSLDYQDWDNLEDGDIVELTGTLKLPEMAQALDAIQGFSNILPLFKQMQDAGQIPSDPEDQEMMDILEAMSGLGNSTANSSNAAVVIVELDGDDVYRFVADLKKDYLRANVGDLSGEVKALGKVHRKLAADDPPIGMESLIPGFESFKGIMNSSMDSETSENDMGIGYPAATIIPIAIWL